MIHELHTESRPVAELHTYHKNPRKGALKEIKESLTVNGQYKPIVVNRGSHTGRADEVLAGNHTLRAARDLGWPAIVCVHVDVDEDQAARIVLADNRVGDLGEYDNDLLADILDSLPDLGGTGYTDEDLMKLMDDEFDEADVGKVQELPTTWGVIVRCDTEEAQQRLLEQLSNEGFDVRALMT